MTTAQLRTKLTDWLKEAEPLDSESTLPDPQHVATTAAKKLALLGYGGGALSNRAYRVETPQECAAVLAECLRLLPQPAAQTEPPKNGELLTLKQASGYLGYSESGLRKLAKTKRIKFMQNGTGPIRFVQEWLDEFVETLAIDGPDNEPARVYSSNGFGFN